MRSEHYPASFNLLYQAQSDVREAKRKVKERMNDVGAELLARIANGSYSYFDVVKITGGSGRQGDNIRRARMTIDLYWED